MSEVPHCRVVLKSGPVYLAVGRAADLAEGIFESEDRFVCFTTASGQVGFSDEQVFVRPEDVTAVQECSPEGWVWQQMANEKHYAAMVADFDPGREQVEAFKEMVAVLKGEDEDE